MKIAILEYHQIFKYATQAIFTFVSFSPKKMNSSDMLTFTKKQPTLLSPSYKIRNVIHSLFKMNITFMDINSFSNIKHLKCTLSSKKGRM